MHQQVEQSFPLFWSTSDSCSKWRNQVRYSCSPHLQVELLDFRQVSPPHRSLSSCSSRQLLHTHFNGSHAHILSAPGIGPRNFGGLHTQVFHSSDLSGFTLLIASSSHQTHPKRSTPLLPVKGREILPKDKHDRADRYNGHKDNDHSDDGPEVVV